MCIKSIIGAACTCLAVVSFNANATLISRLGGLAYYDDEADLTWLADANAGAGSIYDDIGYNNDTTTDGLMTWQSAMDWATNLEVAGATDWRLPDTLLPDAGCDVTPSDGSGYNCSGSELGNLFYNVLGGVAHSSITTTHNSNYDLFTNIQSSWYWSATEYSPPNTSARVFSMGNGDQGGYNKTIATYAWAVHSGDVNAVPEPTTIWLLSLGLGLIGFARRKV